MLRGCRSVDDFERLGRIDEGTYGTVYKARDKATGQVVALKRYKLLKEAGQEQGFSVTSLREFGLLLAIEHPHIVQVSEVVASDADNIFLVMEFVEHELKDLMEGMARPFAVSEAKTLLRQLLSAVSYLHHNWVIHRDLKTSNLLYTNQVPRGSTSAEKPTPTGPGAGAEAGVHRVSANNNPTMHHAERQTGDSLERHSPTGAQAASLTDAACVSSRGRANQASCSSSEYS